MVIRLPCYPYINFSFLLLCSVNNIDANYAMVSKGRTEHLAFQHFINFVNLGIKKLFEILDINERVYGKVEGASSKL